MNTQRSIVVLIGLLACVISLCDGASAADKQPAVQLTEQGQKLATQYSETLDALREQIKASLPAVDEQKKATFLNARAELAGLAAPGEHDRPEVHLAYKTAKATAEVAALDAARPIIADVEAFLSSDAIDAKLMKAAILRHGTPHGLAEFAQQGAQEKALLDKLFADEGLMRQVLVAGGANGGEYGEAMQVYTAILAASERAREPGIFQRLALGTALHMPWIPGRDKGGVYGVVYRTQTKIDQVKRYLHYEQAYLNGELDPAFKDMTTWECRFITNSEYSDEELGWMREMMRVYRPDHIKTADFKWRYVGIVKTDVPYTSTRHDPELGNPAQQAICLGGVCGRRAFFGRLATRAFGIPTRASTQTGHAALSHWTPDGWTINLGAWWSMAWCGPQGGLDFLLDSQAREFPQEYQQVLRAQWIGDALGEEDVSIRHYGQGGGFWDGLAFYQKRAIVADAEIAAVGKELAELSEEEGTLLGEIDEADEEDKGEQIEISDEDREIAVGADGAITIPAAASYKPTNSTDKIAFIESWNGGLQVHYQRLGNRPELIQYSFELPASGKYELTARVATVSTDQQAIVRLNRRTVVDVPLPYTKGAWQQTEPQVIELREGRNSIMLTFRAPNRGVSIKEFRLKPVK